jgi:hypothetical protein
MKKLIILIFAVLLIKPALADSPLTATPFYKAYISHPLVKEANETGKLTQEMTDYLATLENKLDTKAAIINALYKTFDERNKKSELFLNYLAKHYNLKRKKMKVNMLNKDELFCYGYMKAMDEYDNPEKGIYYLQKAKIRNNLSSTADIILALAKSQRSFLKGDNCGAWKGMDKAFNTNELNNDLSSEAVKIIKDYVILYKADCR